MNKRVVNWCALVLLTIVVFACAFRIGTGGPSLVVVLVLAVLAALYVGRRMFARRDRRMFGSH